MEIAIIDDGLSFKYLGNSIIKSIKVDINLSISEDENIHDLNHATECALIIKKYYPDAKFISINIFTNQDYTASVNQLINGIYFAVECNVKLLHFSLGSIYHEDRKKLLNAVNYAADNNIIIVAPSSNDGWITYPATFSNVISVDAIQQDNEKSKDMYTFNDYNLNGVYFSAISKHLIDIITVDNKNEIFETKKCNSYAAPLITAKIAKLLDTTQVSSIMSIINKLANIQNHNHEQLRLYNIDWINKENTLFLKDTKLDVERIKQSKTVVFDSMANTLEEFRKEVAFLKQIERNIVYLNPFIDAYEEFRSYGSERLLYCTPITYDWLDKIIDKNINFQIPILYLKYDKEADEELIGKEITNHPLFFSEYSSLHVSDFYRSILLQMIYIPKLYFVDKTMNTLSYLNKYVDIGLIDILVLHMTDCYKDIIPYCDVFIEIVTFKNNIITFKNNNVEYKKEIYEFCEFLIQLFQGEIENE